jgi:uncharacterized repeat protein (TIGR03803 family)
MTNPVKCPASSLGGDLPIAAFVLVIMCAVAITAMQSAQAQTFTVLHTFTGAQDGGQPFAGLAMDEAGNLYGAASDGGKHGGSCPSYGCGTVFKLQKRGSGWVFSPLYAFQGAPDGTGPQGVVIGPQGNLFGTTLEGGRGICGLGPSGCGTVFQLRPPATVCRSVSCPWNEIPLYRFGGSEDGGSPANGNLVFDAAGNIYGTTYQGGAFNDGTVYEMTHSQGGGWTESVLYSFTNGWVNTYSGVIFDGSGNLYGTTTQGSQFSSGAVYQLTPSGSGWTGSVLTGFQCGQDGCNPRGGLIIDSADNLYGGTGGDGPNNGGTVYELVASQGWNFNLVFSFNGPSGGGPIDRLAMDAVGNLYGTTNADGIHQQGSVFKLTPSSGGWILTDLHDFTGGSDGGSPEGGVVLDTQGNIYGTTAVGGNLLDCVFGQGCGVVWEITP